MRRLQFNRWGIAENPIGLQVRWTIGERTYLADVTGVYRREHPSAIMLQVRHFNGEPMPDVAASAVEVIC